MPQKYILKILTAGEGGVGKTTLLHRYVEGRFSAETKMTIGVEFFLKETEIEEKQCTLQLWDFGGQERFRFLLESYVLGAKGALLMFDLTRMMTLENLEQWLNIVRKGDPNLPVLFLGTKLDLEDEVQVDDDYAKTFLDEYNLIDFLKISSKTGENVSQAFEILTRKILERQTY
jgi:small GTP-binding protein